jgi:crotonobetaine/carnitine-CoA ligase
MDLVPVLLSKRVSDAPFLSVDGVSRTFREANDVAERLSGSLYAHGVRKGDRVATILPNTIDHVDLIFACAKLGAIHVPVNVFLKGEFLRYQLDDCEPKAVIADEAGANALREIGRSATQLELDGDAPDVVCDPSDPMAIIYTSGTTGMPKGCVLPFGYHAQQDNSLLGYREGDVLYSALPLFHGWARGMLFAALSYGLEMHLDAEFSASSALERIRATRATVFSGVGAMGLALLAQPETDTDRDNSLRVAFIIPFSAEAEARFTKRFGPRVQSQMYGQTETGAITFTPLAERGKPGTIGKPSPVYDVQLADDGEVLVREKRPDSMLIGYWPERRTAEWHHTGDLARIDDDGYFVFVDRKKDALRRRGENISSVQLEAAILSHDKIVEAAVVAVEADLGEDEIKACIVSSDPIDPSELFAFFRERLPYFAIPRYVEFVDALPKTATMRVQKHRLREAGITPATTDFEALGLTVAREERRSSNAPNPRSG